MNAKYINVIGIIISFIIGSIVGTGGYWKYQNMELTKTKVSIQLSGKLSELMEKIINTNATFKPLNLCNGGTPEAKLKAKELHEKLSLYEQNFNNIEKKLAGLENRKPRHINLDFKMLCPLKVTLH